MKGLRAHHLAIIAGSLVCLAAMWLPVFDDWVPAYARMGEAAWAWLLVPFMLLPSSQRGVFAATRWVLIGAGGLLSLGVLLSALVYPVLVVLLPVTGAILMIGWFTRGAKSFVLLLSIGTLLVCAGTGSGSQYGLWTLAGGALTMLVGVSLWIRHDRAMRFEPEVVELPRAVVAS